VPNFFGNGLYYGVENDPTAFYVYAPKYLDGNLSIEIIDANKNNIKANIDKLTETLYEIKYLPVEVGTLCIVIKYNEQEVPNSPYQVRVVRPSKVRLLDEETGLLIVPSQHNQPQNQQNQNQQNSSIAGRIYDLEVNHERTLCFDTAEAGPGHLVADILGPGDEKLPFRQTREHNMHKVSFTPFIDGQYKLLFWLNNYPLTAVSPIIARTINYSVLSEIRVYGLGVYAAELNTPAEFFIDCSRIRDLDEFPQVSFRGFFSNNTTSNELKISVCRLCDNIYKCVYVAEKPGRYVINIKFNRAHLACSPFEILIGVPPSNQTQSPPPPQQQQPAASNSGSCTAVVDLAQIKLNREEFKTCIFGEELQTRIDTREVGGPGELTAFCTGSTRAAKCEFVDQRDGTYMLKIKPEELGKHLLQIKFNEVSLPGSPFSIRVSGPPDASKVTVLGPGICHGRLDSFESKFLCNTKGAGAGQLTVRIRGPKGWL
jgi:filamin